LAWALVVATGAAASGQAGAAPPDQTSTGQAPRDQASPDKAGGLVIEPEELPVTYPQAAYGVKLSGRGDYVPTLHWRLESGALPPGITLDESGELRGTAERVG